MKPLALVTVVALALVGCSAAQPATDDSSLSIVASTSVYGSIASAIAGDSATVTSLIDNSAQDPHSFEASATDQLAISKADIVIENGGGYDPFIDTLVEASGSTATVLSASELSGLMPAETGEAEEAAEDHDHEHIEGFNEHVWYKPAAMVRVAEALRDELSNLDPSSADLFAAHFDEFAAAVDDIESQAATLKQRLDGRGAAITEPVPLYLLTAVGLVNLTPEAFSEAIEEGSDVPPAALAETLDLFSTGDVALLAYNTQTASPETEEVAAAARAAGVPVVDFTETLPDGEDYLSWMTANLDSIAAAIPE